MLAFSRRIPTWRSVRIITVLVVIVLDLVGCISMLPAPLPPFQDTSLLTQEPCGPPCWYGIVPGHTSGYEARRILNTIPFVETGSIREDTSLVANGQSVLEWRYKGAILEHHGGIIYIQDHVVSGIIVGLPRCLRLDAVIERVGEPTLVRAEVDGETTNAWFKFYYRKGLMLHGRYPQEERHRARISPDTCINEADYFQANGLETYLLHIEQYVYQPSVLAKAIAEYEAWPGLDGYVSVLKY